MATELTTNLSSYPLLVLAVLAVLLASSVTDVTAKQLTEEEIADLRNFVAQWDEVIPDRRSCELFLRDVIVQTYAAQYKNFDFASKILMAVLNVVKPFLEKFTAEYYKIRDLLVKYETDINAQTELIFENLRKMFAMLPANFKTEKMLNDIATAYWDVAQAKFPNFDKAVHEKVGQIFAREVLEFSSNTNTDTDTKTKPTDEL